MMREREREIEEIITDTRLSAFAESAEEMIKVKSISQERERESSLLRERVREREREIEGLLEEREREREEMMRLKSGILRAEVIMREREIALKETEETVDR